MSQKTYEEMLRLLIKRAFPLCEKLGFHVALTYWENPIPDTRTLGDALWSTRTELVGLAMRDKEQLELLDVFSSMYKAEYDSFPIEKTDVPYQYYLHNKSFEGVDGEVLYCMIRHFKPKKIIEIGSGNSTLLSAQAILRNKKDDPAYGCEFLAIEPCPRDFLREGFPGLTRLIPKKVQEVPISEFQTLGENDILFIDSSHILQIGGDVVYEFNEIVPRLQKGVLIHVHDIFLPEDYPRKWVMEDHKFFSEQYLLQAFLAFNSSFKVVWAGNYMGVRHPDEMERAFRSYKRRERRPGSFWMRRVN
jgi:hypothetical protein